VGVRKKVGLENGIPTIGEKENVTSLL